MISRLIASDLQGHSVTRGGEASSRKQTARICMLLPVAHMPRSQHSAHWQLTGTTDVLASDTQ